MNLYKVVVEFRYRGRPLIWNMEEVAYNTHEVLLLVANAFSDSNEFVEQVTIEQVT